MLQNTEFRPRPRAPIPIHVFHLCVSFSRPPPAVYRCNCFLTICYLSVHRPSLRYLLSRCGGEVREIVFTVWRRSEDKGGVENQQIAQQMVSEMQNESRTRPSTPLQVQASVPKVRFHVILLSCSAGKQPAAPSCLVSTLKILST